MSVAHQGRDQIAHVRMGAKRDGTITAFHVKILADFGAYNMILTPLIPSLGRVRDGRLLQDPQRPDRHHRRVHQQVPDRRDPRRRPPRGDADDRGHARPARRTSWGSIRWRSGAGTSSPRRTSRRRSRPAWSTTPATTTETLDKLMEHVDVAAFRAEQAQLRAQGDLPRDRVLHLDRDLRAGAIADHRPGRGRRSGRPVGVGDGPRPQHRRGHRLLRDLAARSGARDGVRADRRRQARRRSRRSSR